MTEFGRLFYDASTQQGDPKCLIQDVILSLLPGLMGTKDTRTTSLRSPQSRQSRTPGHPSRPLRDRQIRLILPTTARSARARTPSMRTWTERYPGRRA